MNIRFETKRLLVRDIEKNDLDALLQIYTKEKNMKYVSTGNFNWTMEQLSERFDRLNINYIYGFGIFVAVEKYLGKIIGEAGLFDSYKNKTKLELGYILDSQYWGKGYGFEICMGLINYSFGHLNIKSVVARMYAVNIASVRLSEKCGMQKTNSGLTDKGVEFLEYEISNP